MAEKKTKCKRLETKGKCTGCPQIKNCDKPIDDIRNSARAKNKRRRRYKRRKAKVGVHS